jgi:hypothetical protein
MNRATIGVFYFLLAIILAIEISWYFLIYQGEKMGSFLDSVRSHASVCHPLPFEQSYSYSMSCFLKAIQKLRTQFAKTYIKLS